VFGAPKSAASLSSGLLARKGQARPAMRPQGFLGSSMNLDDLGWNDMGDEAVAPPPVVAIAPATPPTEAPVPPVLIERETLREGIEVPAEPAAAVPADEVAPPAAEPAAVAPARVARIRRDVAAGTAKGGAKAAFTLRLDADRHLRLRLASASRNRSAQSLVVAALDAFIATLPEIEGLASQLSTDKTSGEKS